MAAKKPTESNKENEPKFPFPKGLTRNQRRLLILVASAAAGVSCLFVPVEYQTACKGAVKVLSFLIGVPS